MPFKKRGRPKMSWEWFEHAADFGTIAETLAKLAAKHHKIMFVLPHLAGVTIVTCRGTAVPKKEKSA